MAKNDRSLNIPGVTTILLVNFGGPRTLDEVPPFLKNMMGRSMPEKAVEAVVERYRAIGGGSPLASITEQQAGLLTEETAGRFAIRGAFRYTSPSLEERINECHKAGVERIVFFVMSPYDASRTTGGYVSAVEAHLARLPYRPKILFIHGWHSEPQFIECWAARIRGNAAKKGAFYIFSAHSLPASLKGEPYMGQVEETARAIAEKLDILNDYAVAWQSVPQNAVEPWMDPSVEATVDSLTGKVSSLVEIPVGFVSDHLETLYDMDLVHRAYAEARGFQFSRIPSLNTYPPFIGALKTILEKHLEAEK